MNNTTLDTYKMIVSIFFISDKDDIKRFFEGSLLLANVKPDVVFRISFLTMSNVDVHC